MYYIIYKCLASSKKTYEILSRRVAYVRWGAYHAVTKQRSLARKELTAQCKGEGPNTINTKNILQTETHQILICRGPLQYIYIYIYLYEYL